MLGGCLPPDLASALLTVKNDKSADDSPTPAAWSGLSFKDTGLYGLFTHYPYDTRIAFEQQYPRVALTVIDTPPNHAKASDDPEGIGVKACWRIRAKIWPSSTASQNIQSFHWCSPRDIVNGVPMDGVAAWISPSGEFDHTGNQRTEGPVPPQYALPTDLRHQAHWQTPAFSPRSMDGIMLSSLLYYMGFDWSNVADRRVWVVEFIPAR